MEPTLLLHNARDGSLRALLVDPNAADTEEIRKRLAEAQPCNLEVCSTGQDALGRITPNSPDLLILSEGLPDVGNLPEFLQRIRRQNLHAYMIVLLAGGSASSCLNAGADDCIARDDNWLPRLLFSFRQGAQRVAERKPALQPVLAGPEEQDSKEARTLQEGDIILHYRIVSQIGHGGMGEVYEATDLKLGRRVALKVLPRKVTRNDEARRRLVSEARAASALNHPNIVTIHSIEQWQSIYFIVMEYVEGRSLGSIIAQGPLPFPLLLEVGVHVAEALSAAHRIGVIHRDIKPGNIMIAQNRRVKLLDFGLAKKFDVTERPGGTEFSAAGQNSPGGGGRPADRMPLTEAGQVMGTVSYMSPEQMRGEALDGRSDIFSLGCVLYEAATGKAAFPGPSIHDLLYQIAYVEPTPASVHRLELPRAFDTIIGRAMAKDRELRYATAADLAAEFRTLQKGASSPDASEKRELWIGVLYFENLSGSSEEEYFRDGITEDIILELSKIKNLRVLSRSAVAPYRDKETGIHQIARELRASFLVTGSVRREGQRVRIVAELLDPFTGQSLWTERYDRELKDILTIQEEIARNIARALRITLSPLEEKAIASKPADNADAYDYYLRGRNFVRRATRADLEFAMQMFECAIQVEKFALAYAGLSNVCALFYDWYDPQDHWIRKALATADTALALEQGLPAGLAARARISWSQRNYEEAVLYAKLAIERQADCEGAYWTLGQALFSMDRWQEVCDLAPTAIAASGDDYNVYVPLINSMGRLGNKEEEIRLRQMQSAVLKEQLRWVPEDVRARILLATNHAFFSERFQATQELNKAVSLRPHDANLLYNAACAFGVMGMKEEAFVHLKKATENGFWNMEWISRDPDLSCLHDDPEFKQFLADNERK